MEEVSRTAIVAKLVLLVSCKTGGVIDLGEELEGFAARF